MKYWYPVSWPLHRPIFHYISPYIVYIFRVFYVCLYLYFMRRVWIHNEYISKRIIPEGHLSVYPLQHVGVYVIKVHEYSVCNKHYYFSVCDKHYFYYFYCPLLRDCTSMRAQRPNASVRAHLPTHNSLSLALSLSHTQPPPQPPPLFLSVYTNQAYAGRLRSGQV